VMEVIGRVHQWPDDRFVAGRMFCCPRVINSVNKATFVMLPEPVGVVTRRVTVSTVVSVSGPTCRTPGGRRRWHGIHAETTVKVRTFILHEIKRKGRLNGRNNITACNRAIRTSSTPHTHTWDLGPVAY